MKQSKFESGAQFPNILVNTLNDKKVTIGKPQGDTDWKMVVVYRGRHCPKCTQYLNALESYKQRLLDINVNLAAVSGDSKEQFEDHLDQLTRIFHQNGKKVDFIHEKHGVI